MKNLLNVCLKALTKRRSAAFSWVYHTAEELQKSDNSNIFCGDAGTGFLLYTRLLL